MGVNEQTLMLRPLGIGEIFDRAITLVLRNIPAFAIVTLVGILPYHVCQYIGRITYNPGLLIFSQFLLIFQAIATLAIATMIGQVYRNERVTWTAALATGLSKILAAVGSNIVVGFAVLIPLVVVLGLCAAAGLFRFANVFAMLVGGIAIGLSGLWVAVGMMMGTFSLCGIAIDDIPATDSAVRSFGLLHGWPTVGRTLIFALAVALVTVGGGFLSGAIGGYVYVLTKQVLFITLCESIIMALVTPIANAIVAVFYIDFRVRREGYDMRQALEALETP